MRNVTLYITRTLFLQLFRRKESQQFLNIYVINAFAACRTYIKVSFDWQYVDNWRVCQWEISVSGSDRRDPV